MTVRQRITLLIATAIVVALLVGGGGLLALRQSGRDMDAIYHASLEPIVNATSIRSLFNDTRTGLNRALLMGTVEAAAKERDDNAAAVRKMDVLWKAYYPAMVSSKEEEAAAGQFMAAREQARAAKATIQPMMAAGQREAAVQYMLGTVGPAFNAESKAIESIVNINVSKAAQAFAEAQHIQQQAFLLVALALGFGTLALVVGGIFLAKSVMRPLVQARELAARISEGELGHTLDVTGSDEVSDTLRSLVAMDGTLAAIVRTVRDNAGQVGEAARDIAAGNDELSVRTRQQASRLEETAASMEQMTASVRQNAEGAAAARDLSESLSDEAVSSRQVATDAVAAMTRVREASQAIDNIVVLIEEIAFQTNLLALNAAVEAARAGEHGRGFAVVAGEVRRLAQRSAVAAKDIKGLIATSGERVSEGAVLVNRTGEVLAAMASGTLKVTRFVGEIAVASAEQANGIEQVNRAVTQLDAMTHQNAELVQTSSAASQQANQLATELMKQVSFFRFAA